MSDACHCTITCQTHAAAGEILQAAQRITTLLDHYREVDEIVAYDQPGVTLNDAIDVLRSFEDDLDRYGEPTIGTVQELRALLATRDGEPVQAPKDVPF